MTQSKAYQVDQYIENRYKRTNQIIKRPKGWIIMDTVNNKRFPMDIRQVDTMGFDTIKIHDQFHELYGGSKRDIFLPWHFTIDIVDEKPFIINTRPFTYKSGFDGYENYLTFMIIGDSNIDIYPGSFYKTMAHLVMNQFKFMQQFHVQNEKKDIIYWTGKNFQTINLEKELF